MLAKLSASGRAFSSSEGTSYQARLPPDEREPPPTLFTAATHQVRSLKAGLPVSDVLTYVIFGNYPLQHYMLK